MAFTFLPLSPAAPRSHARPRLGGGGGPFIALSLYNNWDAYANLALGGGVRVSATDSCASVL